MMADYEKAQYIAEIIYKWTGFRKEINAESILQKCKSKAEIDWWYWKIRSAETDSGSFLSELLKYEVTEMSNEIKYRYARTDRSLRKHGSCEETLCWKCKNIGCSWIQRAKPVEGWTADETVIESRDKKRNASITSYFVRECPEYKE